MPLHRQTAAKEKWTAACPCSITLGVPVSLAAAAHAQVDEPIHCRSCQALHSRTLERHQEYWLRGCRWFSWNIALTYNLDLTDDIAFTTVCYSLSVPMWILPKDTSGSSRQRTVALADLRDAPYVIARSPAQRTSAVFYAGLFYADRGRPSRRSGRHNLSGKGMVA